MALIFVEGFDKYGPANGGAGVVTNLLVKGDWNTSTGGSQEIVAGLSGTGYALRFVGGPATLIRTLSNMPRIIGGVRFRCDLVNQMIPMQFRDSGSVQCTITVEQSTGVLNLRNAASGTILGSGPAIVSNSVHYLEWDISFGNAANFQVWLDGASVINGTGDTTTTANNFANQIALGAPSTGTITYDDIYLFDTSGTANNAVLLTNPRVETGFPTSDGTVQFAFGAAVLGGTYARSAQSLQTLAANSLFLRPFTPPVACTLSSITVLPNVTNGTVQHRPVVYADSSGAPGALLGSGAVVAGTTIGVYKTMPLTTPLSLSAGQQYWLGMMTDITGVRMLMADDTNGGYVATSTFASGAPATAPAMTGSQFTFLVFGNLTAMAGVNNWYEVSQQPPPEIRSYVFSATVGGEDLYNFPPLSTPPAAIYGVAVKALCAKSDAGARTVSMRMKSGVTDNGGSASGQALGTAFQWLTSFFPTDPATGSPWTLAGLNSAQSGFRIDS